jgi:cell division cycle 2-like protein
VKGRKMLERGRSFDRSLRIEVREMEDDREPGEITNSCQTDHVVSHHYNHGLHKNCASHSSSAAASARSSSSSRRKRKFKPIVWDLEESKVGTRVLTSPSHGAAPIDDDGQSSPIVVQDLSERDDLSHVNLHKQDVNTVRATPDGFEPGQVLKNLTGLDIHDDHSAPAPPTITRSRWAEDTNAPESNQSSPSLGGSKSRFQRSRISPDTKDCSRATSSSPVNNNGTWKGNSEGKCEHGEFRHPELDSRDLIHEANIHPTSASQQQHRAIDMLKGCRSVDEYEKLNKINEGTYGVVYRARDKKTGEVVALKQVKMEKEKDGFPMTSLREINVLLSLHHSSVVDVKEVVVGNMLDKIFMVMEYMEHDLKCFMKSMKQPFSQSEVKCLMLQLFDGIKYLHDNWVLHRDLKTSNLLLNNRGELKICDYGLARQYGEPLKEYTLEVVTLWYRAPELLLGARKYSTPIDMWSLGCIMAEFLAKEPLFPGKSVIDEIDKIFKTLGTPNEKIWPDFVKLPGV